MSAESEAPRRRSDFSPFRACCLLACLLAACLLACLLLACLLACLLAAKSGRSTLDTKKGYKTKTGSTSSVTLIKTEYWDRAGGGGGGGNISYDS